MLVASLLHLHWQLKGLYFLYKMSIKINKWKINTLLCTSLASTHKKEKRYLPSPWPSFNSHIPSVVTLLMGTPLLGWFAQQFLKSAGNPLDYFTSCLTLELGQVSFHVNQKGPIWILPWMWLRKKILRSSFPPSEREDRVGLEDLIYSQTRDQRQWWK